MLDWMREWLKDAETKRAERVTAYVDGRLSAEKRQQFEAQLAQDDALRAEVAALQSVKSQLSAMPRVRAPRNYTLDPATYGAPEPAYGARAYPALRVATAMAALMFVFMVTLTLLQGGGTATQTAILESSTDTVDDVAVVEEMEMVETAADSADAMVVEEAAPAAEMMVEEVVEESAEMMTEPVEEAVQFATASDDAGDTDAQVARSEAMPAPTVAPFAVTLNVPDVVVPTAAAETMREADEIRPSVGMMEDMATEQTEIVGTETVDLSSPTPNWTLRLLILSAILFMILLALTLWLRRVSNDF